MYWKVVMFENDAHFSALKSKYDISPDTMGTHVQRMQGTGLFQAEVVSVLWNHIGGGVYFPTRTVHKVRHAGSPIAAAIGAIMSYDDTPFFEN